jgi:hypothetical protein
MQQGLGHLGRVCFGAKIRAETIQHFSTLAKASLHF